jgi:hypothetical protein
METFCRGKSYGILLTKNGFGLQFVRFVSQTHLVTTLTVDPKTFQRPKIDSEYLLPRNGLFGN